MVEQSCMNSYVLAAAAAAKRAASLWTSILADHFLLTFPLYYYLQYSTSQLIRYKPQVLWQVHLLLSKLM